MSQPIKLSTTGKWVRWGGVGGSALSILALITDAVFAVAGGGDVGLLVKSLGLDLLGGLFFTAAAGVAYFSGGKLTEKPKTRKVHPPPGPAPVPTPAPVENSEVVVDLPDDVADDWQTLHRLLAQSRSLPQYTMGVAVGLQLLMQNYPPPQEAAEADAVHALVLQLYHSYPDAVPQARAIEPTTN